MADAERLKRESIERSVTEYLAAGGTDEKGIRALLEEGHEDEGFAVGDEVVCAHGSLTGVVVAINGPDAVVSWACRGKSVEHMTDLTHVAHEF